MISLEIASREELDAVIAFYDDVIDNTPQIELYARWRKGAHPTIEGLKSYIDEGSLYLYKEDGAIVGEMALPMHQGKDYHPVAWNNEVPDDQVATFHILGVKPGRQRSGVGAAMVREGIALALANGMKAVRLDTLASNTPAQHLYESLGFEYRGKQHLFAENTAWTDFYFYEYRGAPAPVFRPMRRFKQVLPEQECQELLAKAYRGTLSVIGDGGYPYALPINFCYADGHIWFHCALEGHKIDAIKACDKACFTVIDEPVKEKDDWWYHVRSVVCFGRVCLISDETERLTRLRQLGAKYFPDGYDIDNDMAKNAPRAAVLDFKIEHMSGKRVREK